MKIELYYFKACPSYLETTKNLKKALTELNIKDDIKMIEVTDSEDAIEKKFCGSPSIKINGTDLEHKEGPYLFGCRIYSVNDRLTGTPTKEHILSKLKSFKI